MEHTRTPLTDSFSAAIIYQRYVLLVYQEAQEMERTETQRKILEVGKKEFLEKGFKDASLNKIVAEAGFTKGAFYGYYPDKAALFEDLVDETAKGLLEQFKAAQAAHFDLVSEEKTKDSLKLSTEYLRVFVEYMYAHFDA